MLLLRVDLSRTSPSCEPVPKFSPTEAVPRASPKESSAPLWPRKRPPAHLLGSAGRAGKVTNRWNQGHDDLSCSAALLLLSRPDGAVVSGDSLRLRCQVGLLNRTCHDEVHCPGVKAETTAGVPGQARPGLAVPRGYSGLGLSWRWAP